MTPVRNGPYDVALFSTFAEDLGGAGAGRGAGFRGVSSVASYAQRAPSACALAEVAAETGVTLVGGSIPELCSGRLYNTCAVFDGAGALLGAHRKVHLFDVDIPGGITFRESDSLTPGDEATVLNTAVGRLGVGICFDLRFGELCAVQANRGAQVLVYPGAFNTVTGPLHWELLQRARAVDNQLFVLTCSPARAPAGYQAWGHSTAVGPFGEVLATCDEKPGIVYAELDFSQLAARRRAIPLAQQRRGDVYALLDRGRA